MKERVTENALVHSKTGGTKTTDVRESSFNASLSKKCSLAGFQRYRRALCQIPHVLWDHKTTEQWEADRKFFTKEYRAKRDTTFQGAEKHAPEKQLLMCCD